MIDKEKIRRDLNKYFVCGGKITIDDHTGKVSVTDEVKLKTDIKHKQLPVQFGSVGNYFACYSNSLTTLVGVPKIIGGDFYCNRNYSLETLTGAPVSVGGHFWCDYRPDLGLLRIILSNCTGINLRDAPVTVTQIIQKYLGKGQSGALQCAAELIRAGYRENAKL